MNTIKKGRILHINAQGHLDLGRYGDWVTGCNIHIKLVTPRVANTLDGQNRFYGEVRKVEGAEELTYESATNKHVVIVGILHGEKQGFKLIEFTSLPWRKGTDTVGNIEFSDIQPIMKSGFSITNYNDTETYLYGNGALINVRHDVGLNLILGKGLDRLNPALETQLQAAGFEYKVNDGLVASYHLSDAFQVDLKSGCVWNNSDNDSHYDFHCRHGSLKELTALKGVDAHFVDLNDKLVSGTFDVPKLVEIYDTAFVYAFQGRTKWDLYVLQKGGERGYLVAPRMFINALLNAMGKKCSGFVPSDKEYMLAVKAVDSIFA